KTWTKEDRLAEYLKRADLQEAVNVAADLFATQNKVPLNKVVIPPPPAPAPTKVAAAVAPVKKTGEGEAVVQKNVIENSSGAIKRDEKASSQTN
ncbi:MAG: hypothetical protein JNJ49_14145, partial [Bdellovibrionaceae bacterium]|nr:hypothetical protein [Pseudobdellovibrionaceae bacterium]